LSERITITDGSLSRELRQWLKSALEGDLENKGLYFAISHSIPNWENYLVMKGAIVAYENVLEKMGEIAKARGDSVEEQVIFRSGLN
jgi:hypothetical protein